MSPHQIRRCRFIPALLLAMHCSFAYQSVALGLTQGAEYPLWPATPPGSHAVSLKEKVIDSSTDANDPQRTLSAIAVPGIRAFIPVGGGYTSLVIDKEGTQDDYFG